MNIEKAEAKALMAKMLREIAEMVENSESFEGRVDQRVTTIDEILSSATSKDISFREYKIKLKVWDKQGKK